MKKLNLDDLLKAGECCATPDLKPKERCGSCPMKNYVIEPGGLVCADELVLQLCDALENKQREIDTLHRILDSSRSEEDVT